MHTEIMRRYIRFIGIAILLGGVIGCTTPPAQQDAEITENDTITTRVASCNCGQLKVTCTGPDPERISLCPCPLCQKQSGSAFAIQARFPKEQVTIEGESTSWRFPIAGADPVDFNHCATLGAEFHFCPTCGSTVYYTSDADNERIGIKIGAFADPTFPAPKITGHIQYSHPWTMNMDALSLEVVQ